LALVREGTIAGYANGSVTDPSEIPPDMSALMANWTFPALQQAGVRYTWDGEQAIGMLERSIPTDQLVRD
jgi:hypothetical protein